MNYDNCSDGSFIKMSSAKVAEMAKAKLEWIKQYREKETKKEIELWRLAMIGRFWHRILKKPSPTDEQVKEYIRYNTWWGLNLITERYSDEFGAANRLIKACQYADEIYISTQDLNCLL